MFITNISMASINLKLQVILFNLYQHCATKLVGLQNLNHCFTNFFLIDINISNLMLTWSEITGEFSKKLDKSPVKCMTLY